MQVPILSGIYTDEKSDFRTSYPRNMMPIPKFQGISDGYLRPSDGTISAINTSGLDRGGINWNGLHYRLLGTTLYKIASDGTLTSYGTISGADRVKFTYSFDRLGICADNKLYYLQGGTLTQVTDPDLGIALDVVWADGYFITTDGANIVVTELTDPTSVDPLKYGSSEVNPDPIVAIHKIRNEIYAVNRHTIEVFTNQGGSGFPYVRIDGAQITRGAISRNATVKFDDSVVFLGGRENEPIALWLGINGTSTKISTREVDQILALYTQDQLIADAVLEERIYDSHKLIYVHLSDKTLCCDLGASSELSKPIWFILTSGVNETGAYNSRNFTYVYDKWYCGHLTENKIGYLTNTTQKQWGQKVTWSFETVMLYNESKVGFISEIELVSLTGRAVLGDTPTIGTNHSQDGMQYSMERYTNAGMIGDRLKRIIWRRQGRILRNRIQKFFGDSDCFCSFARLEVQIEGGIW